MLSERLIYFNFVYSNLERCWAEKWRQHKHCGPRIAFHIRRGIPSEAKISTEKYSGTIELLIAICPMLGLLGTVAGMIHVFDVMTVTGSRNARSMAAGISLATISTMAGMVVAISGLYFQKLNEKDIHDKSLHLAHLLR